MSTERLPEPEVPEDLELPNIVDDWMLWARNEISRLERGVAGLREENRALVSEQASSRHKLREAADQVIAYEKVIAARSSRTVYDPGSRVYFGPSYESEGEVLSVLITKGEVEYRIGFWGPAAGDVPAYWSTTEVPERHVSPERPVLHPKSPSFGRTS